MRIAFFNWRCLKNPLAGGAEVYNHQVLRRLVSRGHEATLFTSSFKGGEASETIDGIRHVRYGGRYMMYPKSFICYREGIMGRYDAIVESINGVPFFNAIFAKEKVVSLIHQLTRQNWYSGLPLPLAFMGYHCEDLLLRPYAVRPAIVPSESTKKDLDRLGFKDITIAHGAAEIVAPDVDKEGVPTVIFLGRLTRSKGGMDAIRAFSRIQERFPGARLWVVGRGDEEKRMRGLASKILEEGSYDFFGFVDEATKAELLSRAHLMLAPSAREGWGLVVIEASACGTPVIGYDAQGLRDSIRSGVNGYLASDCEDMASIAIRILEDKDRLGMLFKSSRDLSRSFSWERTADIFEEVLERDD